MHLRWASRTEQTGQYSIGLWWATEVNAVGYVFLVLMGVGFSALAGAAVPARRRWGIVLGLPAALVPHSIRHSYVSHLTEDGVSRAVREHGRCRSTKSQHGDQQCEYERSRVL